MNSILRAIAKWILKLVDFDVALEGNKLRIKITIGGLTVWEHVFDLTIKTVYGELWARQHHNGTRSVKRNKEV